MGLGEGLGRGGSFEEKGEEGGGGEEQEGEGEEADGVVDRVVGGVGGGGEEEVVLVAEAGEDGHGDLDVPALVGGGEEVEGGEGEAEDGSGEVGEGEAERARGSWLKGLSGRGWLDVSGSFDCPFTAFRVRSG